MNRDYNKIEYVDNMLGGCLVFCRCHDNFKLVYSSMGSSLAIWSHILLSRASLDPGSRLNIKMLFYQYRKSHCGDKTVVRSSYFHNGISYTTLYWIRAQMLGTPSRASKLPATDASLAHTHSQSEGDTPKTQPYRWHISAYSPNAFVSGQGSLLLNIYHPYVTNN